MMSCETNDHFQNWRYCFLSVLQVKMWRHTYLYFPASESVRRSTVQATFPAVLRGGATGSDVTRSGPDKYVLLYREYSFFTKCKVQMRHYILGLFYALENTLPPPFPNANYKCDLFIGVISWFWKYSLFQMQSTNVTLFTGVIICFR